MIYVCSSIYQLPVVLCYKYVLRKKSVPPKRRWLSQECWIESVSQSKTSFWCTRKKEMKGGVTVDGSSHTEALSRKGMSYQRPIQIQSPSDGCFGSWLGKQSHLEEWGGLLKTYTRLIIEQTGCASGGCKWPAKINKLQPRKGENEASQDPPQTKNVVLFYLLRSLESNVAAMIEHSIFYLFK